MEFEYGAYIIGGFLAILIGILLVGIVNHFRQKETHEDITSITIPRHESSISSNSSEVIHTDGNPTASERELAMELERLKKKNRFKVVDSGNLQIAPDEPKKIHKKREFIPLEETQVSVNPRKNTDIKVPDNIFRQNTQPQEGILSLPFKLIEIDGVLGCVIFDQSGLVISERHTTEDFDKDRIAAFAVEILKNFNRTGLKRAGSFWLSATLGESMLMLLEREKTGCALVVKTGADLKQMGSLASSLLEQISRHRPKEYK